MNNIVKTTIRAFVIGAVAGGLLSFPAGSAAGDFARKAESDIRLLTYNIHKNLLVPDRQAAFKRILGAIRPDVIVFQEMPPEATSSSIRGYLNTVLNYGSWNIHFGLSDGFNRTVLAARYPLLLTRNDTSPKSSTRGVTIALVDLPDGSYARDLYVLGVHLKAFGGTDDVAKRQKSCDAIAAWLGDARNAPQAVNDYITLQSRTPMVVTGDFNFVAGTGPEITLRTGAIQDQATYGPAVKGDWDGTDLTDAAPVNPDNGNPNTWPSYSSSSPNPTSRIDRFYYTDSAATLARGFILNTQTMTTDQLEETGLQRGDTSRDTASDHLPAVIDLRLADIILPPSKPVPGDYDGDGAIDIAIFRPAAGLWAVRGVTRLYFGAADDQPVPGDYSGDGRWDVGIFRPASGLWVIRGVTRTYFGGADYLPVPGDYSGDGWSRIAVFRPASGLWAVQGLTRAYFGRAGDLPAPADYDGDGTRDIAIFRPATGLWAVRNGGRSYFGGGRDSPLPGNYSDNTRAELAIYRPASGLWAFARVTRTYFGGSNDQPVPADYNGSGNDDIAVFRPDSGLWAVKGITRAYFGGSSR